MGILVVGGDIFTYPRCGGTGIGIGDTCLLLKGLAYL